MAQILGLLLFLLVFPGFSQFPPGASASTDHHMTEADLFIWFDLENTYGQKNNYEFDNPLK